MKIRLDHYCIGDGSYIDVHKFFLGIILATAQIPGMSKDEQGVKNQFKGMSFLISPEPLKQL